MNVIELLSVNSVGRWALDVDLGALLFNLVQKGKSLLNDSLSLLLV